MKRSERLVSLMNYFMESPREHTALPVFSEWYGAAKSSISEDLDIVDRVCGAKELVICRHCLVHLAEFDSYQNFHRRTA